MKLLYIDLFCGAGGTSTGVNSARYNGEQCAKVIELKKIMGFPEDYVLVGTQAEQKKYIGNAVEVNVARAWCESLFVKILENKRKVA